MKRVAKKLNTEINFDRSGYHEALALLNNQVDYHNLALTLCKQLTSDTVKQIDLPKVQSYLNKKSGFLNTQMSAEAYGMGDEYTELLKVSDALESSEFVVLDFDGYHLADTSEIKESFTRRLTDEEEKIKISLDKALVEIQKIPVMLRGIINLQTCDYRTQQLGSAFSLMKRNR